MTPTAGPLSSRSIFSELVRLETEVWTAVDTQLRAEFDLPLSWYEPMEVMGRAGGCRVQDIVESLVITAGGASKLVDRIESAGYCRRRVNPEDRRSSLIQLTSSGRRLLGLATQVVEREADRRIGAVLTPRALAQLGATLTRLRRSQRLSSGRDERRRVGAVP